MTTFSLTLCLNYQGESDFNCPPLNPSTVPPSPHLSLGDVTKQQLHHHRQLLHGLPEAYGRLLRGLAQGLDQVLVGLRVLQLDALDATHVVVVAGHLIVVGLKIENT